MKKDTVYSKRKRARRKARLATIQDSHQECVAENARLKKEAAFLERLLRESEEVIQCHLSRNFIETASMGRQELPVAARPSTWPTNQHHTENHGYFDCQSVCRCCDVLHCEPT